MNEKLLVSITHQADLIVTEDNQIAIAPGVASDAKEPIVIGPLNDEIIEHLSFALQHLRIHT